MRVKKLKIKELFNIHLSLYEWKNLFGLKKSETEIIARLHVELRDIPKGTIKTHLEEMDREGTNLNIDLYELAEMVQNRNKQIGNPHMKIVKDDANFE